MKKLFFCILTLCFLTACASSPDSPSRSPSQAAEYDFSALAEAVKAQCEGQLSSDAAFTDDSGEIAAFFGFKQAGLSQGLLARSPYALDVTVIALLQAGTEANATVIAEKLRSYLDKAEKSCKAAPEAAALIRDAELITRGEFCVLLICGESLRNSLLSLINTEIPAPDPQIS